MRLDPGAPVARFTLALFLLCASPSGAGAQWGAQVTLFDPSIPSAGMAGASAAVFWWDFPNVWINPSQAAFVRGVRYSYSTTDLIPTLADDITFESHQIFIGAHGIGLELSGKPIESLGSSRLDYGESEATDVDGNVIGVYRTWEEVRTLALGVDLVELFSSFRRATTGETPSIQRRLSIAAGHAWKDLKYDSGISIFGVERRGESDVKDFGGLVRVALIDGIGETLGAPRERTDSRLELGGAYSKHNYDEVPSAEVVPAWNLKHYGASVRLTLATPTSGDGLVHDLGSPLVGIGLAWTTTDEGFGGDTQRFGAEASLWDILFLRGGWVEDDGGHIHDPAFGAGLSLQYRKAIGARFDFASYPQAEELDDSVERYGVSAFVDPVRLWREIQGGGNGE